MKFPHVRAALSAAVFLAVSAAASASPITDPGKEYSTAPDSNAAGAASAGTIVGWDGAPIDIYNYSASFGSSAPIQVDAIANSGDAFFGAVIANAAHLLVSVTGDPGGNAVWIHHTNGSRAVWATSATVNPGARTGDLDGLEVWGPDSSVAATGSDSNRVSLTGDPGGVAIFDCDLVGAPGGAGGSCGPHPGATTAAIVAALIALDPARFANLRPDQVDLDALMAQDSINQMLISLRPVDGFLDGGEIFVWTIGGPLSYLVHGGHTWDTANDVTALFGAENVDALEATPTPVVVPIPGTLALLGLGLAGLARIRRHG